ncbi:leucine-rich repeat-containing protein 45-like [Pollicipes pollicipes]|uniref:leucine-rich repeat-containing protein 45-like n=1 Tax=Pollicipes pollicipes TaxID=41117 RepID=UPI0018850A40|nr:leucine-rich repeat-containing protein 45-like [Pollicipes pollicipes]
MSFQEQFNLMCKEFNVEPASSITENLCISRTDGRLDLSGSDVPTEQAAVLGNLLSTTADVTQLCLNDCLLSEDALKALCLGLCLNTSVELLELRGNNVRGPGTEHLATLLKKNGRLRALTLEWNNLGLSPPSFRVFADALRTNRGLTSLDLRSNQLDHQCAAYVGARRGPPTATSATSVMGGRCGEEKGQAL